MSVERERNGRVLVITMRREDKRNAIDREMADGIDAAMNELEDDPELWVGVLTGGPTVFSAGTDLRQDRSPATERGGEYGVIRRARRKPLVAAVEGFAFGGGFEIVLACDLVVASRTARFGLPEVKRGVMATCGGLFRTPRALPLNIAKEIVLTGDPIGPERASELGLVNRLTEPGGALAEALALAQRICENAPLSVSESLHALEAAVAADDEAAWAATDAATAIVLSSADAKEGAKAFLAKRQPTWTGA
ncbi:MAG: crotonase/enoyl-CoA hydratase family protein [Acidimicrobiales bacterium]